MGYKAKEVLNTLAKTAADAYLKHGSSLNESLKKTASVEGLEPHQVEYVAAEANKMVWAHNFKLDKKAAYDFPLADPHVILDESQVKPVEKIAAADLDYMLPPSSMDKVASEGQVYGEFKTDITDGLDRRQLRQTLQSRYEKLAAAKEDMENRICMQQMKIAGLKDKFVKEARAMLIETPFTERLEAMDTIAEFVRGAGSVEVGRELMSKLAAAVAKAGLVKEADMRAPEEYISETLPARIINGNHSLYITIDTIVKAEHCLGDMNRNFIIADGTLPVLKEKIREL